MAGLAVAGATLLLLFPPERYGFYPRCPVHAMFGVLCPGCGGTRALAALLRGHVREAMGWNALVTVAALAGGPAAGGYAFGAEFWPERMTQARLGRWQQPLAGAGLLVAGGFMLWRNLG